jgi:hypothetical protein
MMNTTATSVLGAALAGSTGSIVLVWVLGLVIVCAMLLAVVAVDDGNPGWVMACLMMAIIAGAVILLPM